MKNPFKKLNKKIKKFFKKLKKNSQKKEKKVKKETSFEKNLKKHVDAIEKNPMRPTVQKVGELPSVDGLFTPEGPITISVKSVPVCAQTKSTGQMQFDSNGKLEKVLTMVPEEKP